MNETGSMPTFEVKDCYAGTVIYPPGGTYGPRQQVEIQLILLHSGTMMMRWTIRHTVTVRDKLYC